MNILFCNPKNSQGTTHSRKGMYAPLGILSVATVLTEKFGNEAEITVSQKLRMHDRAGRSSLYGLGSEYIA